MRALHILAQLRASGAEQMLRTAAHSWLAAGLELDVLETSAVPGHFGPSLEEPGYRVLRCPVKKHPSSVLDLRRLINDGDYNVVHVHPEGADLIPILAARLAGVPAIVRTVHHIYPYDGLLRRRKRLERRIGRALGTRYICNSRSGSANERERMRNSHRIVFNWYDDNHYVVPGDAQRREARQKIEVPEGTTTFASVGGCAPYKNDDLILQALSKVPNVLYLHAGPEPDDRERLLALELGVEGRVRFLGVVPDARDVFYAADVYLMPSTFEGFGVAAAEAMGCGVPTILSDRPALSDFKGITPGTWIPLAEEHLANAMNDFADQTPEQRQVAGEAASSIVQASFGVEAGATGYMNAYHEALSSKTA